MGIYTKAIDLDLSAAALGEGRVFKLHHQARSCPDQYGQKSHLICPIAFLGEDAPCCCCFVEVIMYGQAGLQGGGWGLNSVE